MRGPITESLQIKGLGNFSSTTVLLCKLVVEMDLIEEVLNLLKKLRSGSLVELGCCCALGKEKGGVNVWRGEKAHESEFISPSNMAESGESSSETPSKEELDIEAMIRRRKHGRDTEGH